MYLKTSRMCWIKAWIIVLVVSLGIVGCSRLQTDMADKRDDEILVIKKKQKILSKESKGLAESYRDIYERAVKDNIIGELATIRDIVNCLGELGYATVDYENQIDMVNSSKVIKFVEKVEQKKKASLTLLRVMNNGGFIRYDMEAAKGEVAVTPSNISWEGNTPKVDFLMEYMAYEWEYSEEGYLFFEREQMPGFSLGHPAVRVEKLDEQLREMNRQYMLPIGYRGNTMFISDWSEAEYQNLNFYDLYEKIYQFQYGKGVPYESEYEGKIHHIPSKEFEDTILSCFSISRQSLREYTSYEATTDTYEYRPRGLYDAGTGMEPPYPEVVSYHENSDGTLTFTVNAVWPKKKLAKAFSHEVVVRPLADGSFQYVSNHLIPDDDNVEPIWYMKRLSKEQWEQYYNN